jgi:hypothetical protein
MKLTEHFTREEMERSSTAIRLGLPNVCPKHLLVNMQQVAEFLETVRAHFKASIHVTSCFRSPAVNAAVGGSATSAHRFAHAADFEVSGVPNIDVCRWIAQNMAGKFDQIIYEFGPTGWVHVGLSGNPRGEILTATKQGTRTVYKTGFVD